MANAINLIQAEDNGFSLDLSKSNIATGPTVAATGDTFQVNLPGIPPAASVTLTSGASEVAFSNGSSLISCVLSAAKSALVRPGQDFSIDVLLTRSGKTYAYEYTASLNTKPLANP